MALLALGSSGCSDEGALEPEIVEVQFAKPGTVPTDPPVVDATDPPDAPQDTALTVLVLGANFDRGSEVDFGEEVSEDVFVPSEKVRATRVKYINQNRLEAEVLIDVDAEVRLYDVMVTTSRGKKGIGTERFQVREKNTGQVLDFEILDFWVEKLDEAPDEAGNRCPDANNPCNKLVLTYKGSVDSFQFWSYPVIKDLYLDLTLDNGHMALGAARLFSPEPIPSPVPHATAPARLEIYWQGQWTPRLWDDDGMTFEYADEETIPDLDPLNAADDFTFMFSYVNEKGGRMWANPFRRFGEAGIARFQGGAPMGFVKVVTGDIWAEAPPPKKKPGQLRMWIGAYEEDAEVGADPALRTVLQVMLTDPDGNRTFLHSLIGNSDRGDLFATGDLSVGGCYEAQVMVADILPDRTAGFDDRLLVWDRDRDQEGTAPFGIVYDAEARSISEVLTGGCG
jgi:hypothetical protein